MSKPLEFGDVLLQEYHHIHKITPSDDTAQADAHNIIQNIHELPDGPTALCLSGGGIRSATFALGLIQALARLRLLERFDDLSTVSGGGYIGSWLSVWISRVSPLEVLQTLRSRPAAPSTQSPEPGQIEHLRRYRNYLSPNWKLLSVDTWTLIATYLRNLFLNWLVLIPALLYRP